MSADALTAQDGVQQMMAQALSSLPWPVSQPPGNLEAETYLTFSEVRGSLYRASNRTARIHHLVQVHAWTKSGEDRHRTALFEALELLQAAGAVVVSWGPDEYERDTGISHIACTVAWNQIPK